MRPFRASHGDGSEDSEPSSLLSRYVRRTFRAYQDARQGVSGVDGGSFNAAWGRGALRGLFRAPHEAIQSLSREHDEALENLSRTSEEVTQRMPRASRAPLRTPLRASQQRFWKLVRASQ